jgi:hypothetical protein
MGVTVVDGLVRGEERGGGERERGEVREALRCHPHPPPSPPLQPDAYNFAVYASGATSVSLCLFTRADLDAGRVTAELPLDPAVNRTGHVWHALVPGLDEDVLYGEREGGNERGRGGERAPLPPAAAVAAPTPLFSIPP